MLMYVVQNVCIACLFFAGHENENKWYDVLKIDTHNDQFYQLNQRQYSKSSISYRVQVRDVNYQNLLKNPERANFKSGIH